MDKPLELSLEDYDDTITVTVDSGKQQIKMDLVAKVVGINSGLFRVKSDFVSRLDSKSRQDFSVDLSGFKVDTFGIFLAWNATGELESSKRLIHIENKTEKEEKLHQYQDLWDQLLECYFLSDYIKAPNFGNSVISALIEAIKNEILVYGRVDLLSQYANIAHLRAHQPEDISTKDVNNDLDSQYESQTLAAARDALDPRLFDGRQMLGTRTYQLCRVYSNTAAKSPLRRMIVDHILLHARNFYNHINLSAIVKDETPLEFRQDLLGELVFAANGLTSASGSSAYLRKSLQERVYSPCKYYHIHNRGENCFGSDNDRLHIW